ncbi:MAG: iron-sulfur cluster repair di-iron protein [Planctomycetota bacterium]|jgi:regulator of cell morphogenesis and NO signaling
MSDISAQTTIAGLVVERPGRAQLFETLGLDYCCGGGQSLAEACAKKGLDLDVVVSQIVAHDALDPRGEDRDWSTSSLTDLVDHIEGTHHVYLREKLPWLLGLAQKVARVHGDVYPDYRTLACRLEDFIDELGSHMMKEERVLFPAIRQMEAEGRPDTLHCGSVVNPIEVMEHEHDDAGDALGEFSRLTNDFTPPPEACNSLLVMMEALSDLERNMHQHVHKENNILFPRAIELEASLASA